MEEYNILENLFYQHKFNESQYHEEWQRILTNQGMLKKSFNKWQKKMLILIIDDQGLITEKMAMDSFASGVKFGVKFMIEALGT